MNNKRKILISNDDGIDSEGIKALALSFSKDNEVYVVAPDSNRTASGHSLSIGKSLYLKKYCDYFGATAYSLSGTPADCVKFAINQLKFTPEIVLSGINDTFNLGSDTVYSGTISCALEAVYFGIPSFAFSTDNTEKESYKLCAEIAKKIVNENISSFGKGYTLNVNIPDPMKGFKGIKYTKLGIQKYSDFYRLSDDGGFALGGEPIVHGLNDGDCDVDWCAQGFVTVTPLLFNFTDYNTLSKLQKR